jgi:type IV pilus assembly protein PilQ
VLIEARIVIVNDDFTRELGVRAGYTGIRAIGTTARHRRRQRAGVDTSLASALDNLQATARRPDRGADGAQRRTATT